MRRVCTHAHTQTHTNAAVNFATRLRHVAVNTNQLAVTAVGFAPSTPLFLSSLSHACNRHARHQ